MTSSPPPVCEICKEKMTIKPIFTNCKKYKNDLLKNNLKFPDCLNNNRQNIENLLEFLLDSGLFYKI